MRFIITTFLLLSLSACRPDDYDRPSHSKVIAGEDTKAPRFFASLFYVGEKVPFCGAVMVAEDKALTAAHCVSAVEKEIELHVALDELIEPLSRPRKIEALRVHTRYHKGRITYDLAVLYLEPERGKDKVAKIVREASAPLRVYGFGTTDALEDTYPQRLQSVALEELPFYACQDLGAPFDKVSAEQICATGLKDSGADSCYGDSGGPLLDAKGKLYGIVSWGVSCGRNGLPGVYTRVADFEDWIHQEIEDESLLGAIFYTPLIYNSSYRFTAAFHNWKKSVDRSSALQTWVRKFRGKEFQIDLIAVGVKRFKLRLKQESGVFEAPARFTEL